MDSREAELTIEKIVGRGLGLAHGGGATWLVSGVLPGEVVRARTIRQRAGVREGVSLEVVDCAHPARLDEPCVHSDDCGGCDWPHVDPNSGGKLKSLVASEAARTHADLAAMLAAAPIRLSPPAYRLRARLHWDPDSATLGFYGPRSWKVTRIDECRILSPGLMRALPTLAGALKRRCGSATDLEWLENLDGSCRIAALRPARSGPVQVDPRTVPSSLDMDHSVQGFHILGKSGKLTRVWGETFVHMDLPHPLQVPVGGFFQGNRHLVPWLFDRVRSLVGGHATPTFDLHAGVGFLAAAAQSASERDLVLVEPYRPAAHAAEINLRGAKVFVGSTAESFLARTRQTQRDALVLTDPPRSGMSRGLRKQLAEWHPHRMLMLACDPATWARDAAFFVDHGYEISDLELIDLFPFTHHVEVLAMMESD